MLIGVNKWKINRINLIDQAIEMKREIELRIENLDMKLKIWTKGSWNDWSSNWWYMMPLDELKCDLRYMNRMYILKAIRDSKLIWYKWNWLLLKWIKMEYDW